MKLITNFNLRNIQKLFLFLLFLTVLITTSSATPAVYIPDLPVTNGILSNSTHSGFSYPEIVIDNGEWTSFNNTLVMIISGETVQESIGYEWNGTHWILNPYCEFDSDTVGYVTFGSFRHSVYFNDENDRWEAIGANTQVTHGFYWDPVGVHPAWEPGWFGSNDVMNGIGTHDYGYPEVIQMEGDRYVLFGEQGGVSGYKWNGTGYDVNSDITSGIISHPEYTNPHVYTSFYNYSGTELLVVSWQIGWNTKTTDFYVWNGSGWDVSSLYSNGYKEYGLGCSMFEYAGELRLIQIENPGIGPQVWGYSWNGTSWNHEGDTFINTEIFGLHNDNWPVISTWEESNDRYAFISLTSPGDGLEKTNAYRRDGTSWIKDNSKIAGIPEFFVSEGASCRARFEIFFDENGNKRAITRICSSTGDKWTGWDWNGTGFEQNATVISGIDFMCAPEFELFEYNNETYFISIDGSSGAWHGFIWNGNGWTSNATILTGLTTGVPSTWCFPVVFEHSSGDIKMFITDGNNEYIYEYTLTGSGWVSEGQVTWRGRDDRIPTLISWEENGKDLMFVFSDHIGFNTYFSNGVPPSAPTNIAPDKTSWETGDSNFTITFTPPTDPDGLDITSYLYLDNTSTPTTLYAFTPGSSFDVGPFNQGEKYYYRIVSKNPVGTGIYSNTYDFRYLIEDGEWHVDNAIINGLNTGHSFPEVFRYGLRTLMITGTSQGNFYSYEWDSESEIWVLNSTIKNGIPDNTGTDTEYFQPFTDIYYKDGCYWNVIGFRGSTTQSTDEYRGYKLDETTWTWEEWTGYMPGGVYTFDSLAFASDPGYYARLENTGHMIYDSGSDEYYLLRGYDEGYLLKINVPSLNIRSTIGDFGLWSRATSYNTISDDHKIIGYGYDGSDYVHFGLKMTSGGSISTDSSVITGLPNYSGSHNPSGLTAWYDNGVVKLIRGGSLYSFYIVDPDATYNQWETPPASTPTPTPTPSPTSTSTYYATPTPVVVVLDPTPTPEPTPVIELPEEEEEELTMFEEIISFIGKAFSWLFILAAYFGAFIASVILMRENEDINDTKYNILFFGTVGWVLPLIINSIRLLELVTSNFWLNALIFAVSGLVVYAVLNMFGGED